MGNFRKAIASISLVAILSTLVVTTTAFAAYSDVPADHYAYNAVTQYEADGVLTPGATLRVDDPVNRAEFAKMLVAVGGFEGDTLCSANFDDCVVGAWYDSVLGTAFQNNIFRGNDDGMMMPGNNILRADLATVLHRAAGAGSEYMGSDYFPDVPEGAYYDAAVGWAYCNSVVSGYGDGSFGPARNATRGEGIVMLWRAYSGMTGDIRDACTAGPVDPTDPTDPVATGGLTVDLSDDTPDGATLPSGATSVPVATWDFTAGEDDATLESLEVHMFGVSSLPADHQVYLYEGKERLTSGRSINTTTRVATFNNLNLDIADGETRTLTLRLDVGTVVATGELAFEITGASAVNAGGEVEGSFPVQGEVFGTSTTDAGTVTVEKNGSVPNPKVGEDDVAIAKFKITSATEAAWLEEFGLYITGNVSTDAIQNFELYVSGEDDPIATVESLNDQDVVAFEIEDGFEIPKGDNKAFWVQADLNTGRADDTIKAYVDEESDVRAIGDIYGFGMQVVLDATNGYDGTSCTNSSGKCTFSTVEGGDVTISSNGPVAQDIAISGDDVALMDFSITSVADMTVKTFPIQLTASESADTTEGLLNDTTGAANFTDIRIVNTDTGETLMGPIDADVLTTALGGATAIAAGTDAADAFYLFNDEFDMEAGDELNLSLTADVENVSTLTGMTVVAALELGTTYPEIRDANNKVITNSATLVPASPITGKTMTVRSPSLTLSLAAVPASQTYVKGEDAVQFTGISATCGSSSDCDLVDVTITGSIDDDNDGTYGVGQNDVATDASAHDSYLNEYVGSIWLEDADGNVVAASKPVQSDGTVNFTSVDWTIDGGETVVFYVVGDISTDSYKNDDGERISFAVQTAGDITFEDEDGNIRDAENTVNASESTVATTSDGGSLTVAVDAATAKETIVVAGAADQAISKFFFETTDEAFTVTKLSINARQANAGTAADVADGALGAYDDNVVSVKLSYPKEDGTTGTKTGSLTNGTVQFEGLEFYIDKDEDAVLSVNATLNTIEAGADSGAPGAEEFVDLNIGFNNFEAVAESSGETYKGGKLDADLGSGSDLDFRGTINTDVDLSTMTWIDSATDADGVTAAIALDATTTLTYDAAGPVDSNVTFPIGTILCLDSGATTCATDEPIYVVTSLTTDGAADDSVTVRLIDNGNADNAVTAAGADNDNILYALPGSTSYLAGANQMHVHGTVPTLTLNSDNPSGNQSVSPNDTVFNFDISANSRDKVSVRAGKEYATCVAGTGITLTTAANTTTSVDGSSCEVTAATAIGDSVLWATADDLSTYSYVAFWVRWNDDGDNSVDLNPDTFSVATADANDGTEDQETVVLAANLGGSATTDIPQDTWIFVHDVAMPTEIAPDPTFIGLQINDDTELTEDADDVFIDEFMVYNDKITVNFASDASMAAAGNAQEAILRGGVVDVTGYVMEDTTSAGSVTFIPTSGADLQTAKGTTTEYSVETNTSTLITDQAGTDDQFTPSITYGTATAGSVTSGSFWWYDQSAAVRWFGYNASSSLSGNTLRY